MASFLDYFIFNTPEVTHLPRLRIHDKSFELQRASEEFFTIPDGALAAENNKLAVSILEPFSTKKENHRNFIGYCTKHYEEKAQALYDLDFKIKVSLLVTVVAYGFSFLPIVGWFTIAGMFAALYFSIQRPLLVAEQQDALRLLTGVCNWSIGPGPDATASINDKIVKLRQDSKEELLRCTEIQDMMVQLAILDETQTARFLADDIQQHFLKLLDAYDNSFTFFGKRNDAALAERAQIPELEKVVLQRRGAEFNRCIYGLNKGKPKDFIDAFLSALPDLWQATKSTWKACVTPAPVSSPSPQ